MPWHKMLVLAILAGAFIALGGAFATIAGSGFSGIQSSLIKGAVFPLGLMLVVICGSELFTGNCLLIAPALSKSIKPTAMLKNWGIVYIGNFVGAVIIAAAVGTLVLCDKAYVGASAFTSALVSAKSDVNFGVMLLKGIPCNMLVCLAVWAAMASKAASGKILAVYLPVFAFVVCGFEHSVANMFYITVGSIATGGWGVDFGKALLNGLLAPTIGNLIGGALIAVAYWWVYFRSPKTADETKIEETTEK